MGHIYSFCVVEQGPRALKSKKFNTFKEATTEQSNQALWGRFGYQSLSKGRGAALLKGGPLQEWLSQEEQEENLRQVGSEGWMS